MHKLMCRFVTTTKKKKKIPDQNLDTACTACIPCNKLMCRFVATTKKKKKEIYPFLDTICPSGHPAYCRKRLMSGFLKELSLNK